GYVRKQHVLTDLFPAIEAALRGELYLSGGLEFSKRGDAKKRNEGLMHQTETADFKNAEQVQLHHAAIWDSLDDAIITKDLDGIITSWNRAAHRIFGYTEQEVIGRPITMIVPPELRDEENDILRRLRSGQRTDHYETRRVAKDGKAVDVSLTIYP